MRRTAALFLATAAGVAGLPMAIAAADEEALPFVRVTFICKATQDGETLNAPGTAFTAGDYIFRYREEASVGADWTSGVGGSGLHSGSIGADETVYLATQAAVAGVSVMTDPGPNMYGGTASTNEDQPCEYPEPTPTPTPTPTSTEEPTEEPVPTEVPAGRDPVSGGVTSTQLAGLGLVAALGVAGAGAAARTRRRGA